MKKCACCNKKFDTGNIERNRITAINEIGTWFQCDCGNTLIHRHEKIILRKGTPNEKPRIVITKPDPDIV